MNINKRLDSIESKMKARIPHVPPPLVFERNGVYTSKEGEALTKDDNGNFLLEDGSVYYENQNLENGLVDLITISIV